MNGKLVYLDTSSLLKRYIEEKGSEVVDKVYEESEAGNIKTAFSVWNIGEALGVLDRYHRRELITAEELETSIKGLISESIKMIKLDSLQLLPITSTSLIDSWLVVLKHHIYEADALQISSSKESCCDLFLGADKRLIQVAIKEKVNAINIELDPLKALDQLSGTGE
ncbi:MAG: type II toxin-antitoxin system VapC family toxin [Candidatus Bathyarchaeia archaeon]